MNYAETIDRDALLAAIEGELASARLLTLVGPGGGGKTWLARALAARRSAHWVDLGPLADPLFVVSAAAAACGVVEQRGQPLLTTLAAALRDDPSLLVLDTCEHLLAACAELAAALIAACPRLTILATSRAPLRIPAEHVIGVPPLDPPEAQALFALRAAARLPEFAIDGASAPPIAALCAKLAGLPLAIELAAARVPLLTIAQIDARLSDALALLASRDQQLPARQRSLRATLNWSYALLSDAERALLRRLAVFRGGTDLDAIEAVCDLPAPLDALEALRDAALVAVSFDAHGGAARYHLHEMTRQYAAEQLAAAGEALTVRRRHRAWARALAGRARQALGGEGRAAILALLARERENTRAALAAAAQDGDADTVMQIATDLLEFWNVGALGEGRAWLAEGLRLAGETPSGLTAGAWNAASFLAYRQGDYPATLAAAQTALSHALACDDAHNRAEAHYRLGIYFEMQADVPAARAHYDQSFALYGAQGDRRGQTNTLNGLAHIARLAGELHAARELYRRGLVLARASDDRRTTLLLLLSLGNLLLDEDAAQAESCFAESMSLIQALGETSYLPYAANGLGEVARARGDLSVAAAHYARGLQVARELNLSDMTAQLLLKLADVALREGALARAVPLIGECLEAYARIGRTARIAGALFSCAKLLLSLGYPEQAVTLFAAGLQLTGDSDFDYLGGLEAADLDAAYAAARAALTAAASDAAQAAGRALTVERAVSAALTAIHLPRRAAPPPALQIWSFGALRVVSHGHELASDDWVYAKTRALLLYLLHVEAASKEQIGAALWPEASERQLRQNFRMAIYHLRRALGGGEWIAFQAGRYALARSSAVWYDADAFCAILDALAPDQLRRAEQLKRATDLYTGDLAIEGLDSEALLVRREQLHRRALDALIELGALEEIDDPPAAAASYRRALALDGYLEPAHRGLMRALARQGDRAAALAHYRALRTLLARDFAADADPLTRDLAAAIAGDESLGRS